MRIAGQLSAAIIAGVITNASCAQAPTPRVEAANDGSRDVLPQLCASDPDYKFFERIQADAFRENPEFLFLLNKTSQDELKKRALEDLERSNATDEIFKGSSNASVVAANEFAQASAPTCYENPIVFMIISHLAGDMNTARQELGLRLNALPKFGSIPSTDINAYTFTATVNRAGVIAINVQLFNFVSEMVGIITPTIEKETKAPTSKDPATNRAVHVMVDLYSNPELRGEFEQVILGFSTGTPIKVRKRNTPADPFAVLLQGSMERFVFAHEFGHVLLGHKSPMGSLPASQGQGNYSVLARSWKQEFEADAMGVKLLARQWQSMSRQDASSAPYWLYAAKASLVFLACMEVIDEANYARDHGNYEPHLTDEEAKRLRDYSTGRLSDNDFANTGYSSKSNHPPAWLRLERGRDVLEDITKSLRLSREEIENSKRADEAIANLKFLWDISKKELLKPLTGTSQ